MFPNDSEDASPLAETLRAALEAEPDLALRGFGSGRPNESRAQWAWRRDRERAAMLAPAGLAIFGLVLAWPGWAQYRRRAPNWQTPLVIVAPHPDLRGYVAAAAIALGVPYRKAGSGSRCARLALTTSASRCANTYCAELAEWLDGAESRADSSIGGLL